MNGWRLFLGWREIGRSYWWTWFFFQHQDAVWCTFWHHTMVFVLGFFSCPMDSGYETAADSWDQLDVMDSTNKEILSESDIFWISQRDEVSKNSRHTLRSSNPIEIEDFFPPVIFQPCISIWNQLKWVGPWKYGDQDLLHHIIWRGWTSSYPGYFGLNRRVPGSESILTHTHINANHSQGIFHFLFRWSLWSFSSWRDSWFGQYWLECSLVRAVRVESGWVGLFDVIWGFPEMGVPH